MKIDTRRLSAADIARVATIPLIIVGALAAGCVWEIVRGFPPSRQNIEFCLFIDAPLILIIIGVWLSRYRFFLYVGRIGTIIWLLPFGFFSIIILGELEHAEPIVLIIYFIVLLSTVSVTFFLWKKKKEAGKT